MHYRLAVASLSLLILYTACDQSRATAVQPSTKEMSDSHAQRFVLTPDQRSRLIPNINVDSLEHFLEIAGETAEDRLALMQFFMRSPGQNLSFELVGPVNDPTLQALLDQIYAPTWEAWGADAIAHSESRLPGREIARARIGAREHSSSKE
jgi:hypothetical protein